MKPRVACFLLLMTSGLVPVASATEYANATGSVEQHDCLVEPMTLAAIGSPVQAILEELLVDRSERVIAGQPIARLESAIEQAGVLQAEARASMQSEIAAREADLELARLDLERLQDLHRQKLLPVQKLDEARARRQVASAALGQARENRQLAQLDLQRARQQVERRTLKSPVDGVVVERHAFPGEFIYDNPVMSIAVLDPLRIEVVLPSRLFGTLQPGQLASVIPELDGENVLTATVDVVDPLLDTRSGTFGARLTLPNPDRLVAGGQKCRISFDSQPVAATPSDDAAARQLEMATGED